MFCKSVKDLPPPTKSPGRDIIKLTLLWCACSSCFTLCVGIGILSHVVLSELSDSYKVFFMFLVSVSESLSLQVISSFVSSWADVAISVVNEISKLFGKSLHFLALMFEFFLSLVEGVKFAGFREGVRPGVLIAVLAVTSFVPGVVPIGVGW